MLGRCGLCARLLDVALSIPPIQSGRTVFAVASTSQHIFHATSPSSGQRSLHRRLPSGTSRRAFGSAAVSVDIDDAAVEEHVRNEASAQRSLQIIRSAAWKGKARAEDIASSSAEVEALSSRTFNQRSSSQAATQQSSIVNAIDRDRATAAFAASDASSTTATNPVLPAHLSLSQQFSMINQKLDNLAPPASLQATGTSLLRADVQSSLEIESPARLAQPKITSDFSSFLSELLRQNAYSEYKDRFYGLVRKVQKNAPDILRTIIDDAATRLAGTATASQTVAFCKVAKFRLGMWTVAVLDALVTAVEASKDYVHLPAFSEIGSPADYPASTINALLRCYLLGSDSGNAHNLLVTMRDTSVHLSADTFAALANIDLLLPQHRPLLHTILESSAAFGKSTATDALNCIMAAQITGGQMSAAGELYAAFMDNIAPVAARQATSMRLQGPARTTSTSLATLEADSAVPQLIDRVIEPNQATYETFLQGYADVGDFDKALDFYVSMVDSGFPVSSFLSAALVNAYVKRDQAAATDATAIQLTEVLSSPQSLSAKSELQQRVIVSNIALRRILLQTGLAGFTTMVDAMSQQSEAVRSGTINSFLAYLSRDLSMQSNQLVDVVAKLRKLCDWKPNASTLNTLLRDYCAKQKLLMRRKRTFFPGDIPSADYERLRNKLARDPARRAILDLIAGLNADGVRGDDYTSAILMQRMADLQTPPSRVWDFFKWFLLDKSTQPNEHHLSAIIRAYIAGHDPAGARKAMERCKALGVEPNRYHYSMLITGALAKNRPALAENLVLEMQEQGLQPDLHIYVSIADWHARQGDLPQTEATVTAAYSQLLSIQHPSAALQACIFKAKHYSRAYLDAQKLLMEDLDKGMLPTRRLYQLVAGAVTTVREAVTKAAKGKRDRHSLTLHEMDEAVTLGKANLARMQRLLLRENSKIADDKTVQDATQAIANNYRLTRRAKIQPETSADVEREAVEDNVA